MASKGFRLNVVIRILAILALGYSSIYIIIYTHFWLVGIWTTLFAIILIFSLIRYVERSNREMANFLLAIKQGDFSNTYVRKNASGSGVLLNNAFSDILAVFQKLSTERETNHQFLQTVVEHVSIALITFDDQEEIISINQAAKALFRKPYLKNLNSIRTLDEELYTRLKSIKPGEGELIKMLKEGELKNLSLRATEFILKNNHYKIVSIQDIKSELEEKEVESWQKLIRVLTHEIMNSAIPISTLSSVISQMLEDEQGNPLPLSDLEDDISEDVLGGLKTIESRSKGLVKFVDAYKSLTKIDPPKFETVSLKKLVADITKLLKPDLDGRQIELSIEIDKSHKVKGDSELLAQVLINLLKNAMEALEDMKGKIAIESKILGGRTVLALSDNGPGIEPDILENIFVPFFSTKKKGSGIGLSLSRQIMRLHKGSIAVQSKLGVGTTFVLTF